MDITSVRFWGRTKFWWVLMLVGFLMIPCGFWLWMQPVLGYEVLSLMLGWLVIAYGVVQLIVSNNVRRTVPGWGWWLVGGFLDIIIGFFLVSNLLVSETVLPFFFACVFLYKGFGQVMSALSMTTTHKYWWLYLLNGIVLLVLGILFLALPFTAMFSIVFLCAFAFIYWGISLIFFGYSLRPTEK